MDEELKETMERRVAALLNNVDRNYPDTILAMLKPRFVSCDPETTSILMAFPTQAWEANPLGVMQGGIVATVLDCSVAALAVCFEGNSPMTVSMQVSYLRATPIRGDLMVRATATRIGRQVLHAFAECWPADEPGKLTATANCVYLRT